MKTKQLIIYALLAYVFYKVFISKEGFALSTGIIPLADLQSGKVTLDPTKQYYRGIRNTSSTITPQINGGKGCTEYPDVVFKPVPATDAVCRTWSYPDLQDNMYNFDTTAYPGSYHTKIIGLPTTGWVANTIPSAGGSVAQRLFQGRMQCLTTDGTNCLWRPTLSQAQNDAILANTGPAPGTFVIGGPQWTTIPADSDTSDNAKAFRAIRDSASLTNAQLSI